MKQRCPPAWLKSSSSLAAAMLRELFDMARAKNEATLLEVAKALRGSSLSAPSEKSFAVTDVEAVIENHSEMLVDSLLVSSRPSAVLLAKAAKLAWKMEWSSRHVWPATSP